MYPTRKHVQILLALAALLTLSACGGAPSENDIKAAIEKQQQQTTAGMQQLAGNKFADMAKSFTPEIKNVKKIGCKEDGEKAYKCDVEMEVTLMGSTNKGIVPIRFVKGSDGWVASN